MHAFPALHLPRSSHTRHFFCCFPHIISLTSSKSSNTVSRHVYLALKGSSRTKCGVSLSSLIIITNPFKLTLGSSCCHFVFIWYFPDGRLVLPTPVYVSVTNILTAGFEKIAIPDVRTSSSSVLWMDVSQPVATRSTCTWLKSGFNNNRYGCAGRNACDASVWSVPRGGLGRLSASQ